MTVNLVEAINPRSTCCWPNGGEADKLSVFQPCDRTFPRTDIPVNGLASRQPDPWYHCLTTPLGLRHFQHALY